MLLSVEKLIPLIETLCGKGFMLLSERVPIAIGKGDAII
jgi:hypothetical protein